MINNFEKTLRNSVRISGVFLTLKKPTQKEVQKNEENRRGILSAIISTDFV